MKAKKKEHLARWRDPEALKQAIIDDLEEVVSLHFDHGMECNLEFKASKDGKGAKTVDGKEQNRDMWTPIHYAAENGSLNVILALVSRGAGIDPTD